MPPTHARGRAGRQATSRAAHVEAHEAHLAAPAGYAVGVLRIALGWIFLWPFLDKAFGLGFATARDNAWLRGGSPTTGFLSFGTQGPLAEAFQSLAGSAFVDAVFMLGLLGIGVAFTLGIGVFLAAYSGALLLFLMWLALLWPANNPFMDDHLIYAIAMIALAHLHAGNFIGLGQRWARLSLVRSHPILQ